MGCVSSKGDINDRNPNIFHVWNVNELGNVLVPGQMEITENELVLHQKNKESIRWPMRCLRRYGFDAALFSFESGRKCTTGPGIYAFKCYRAEALFNLLQEYIQNSGQDDVSHASHTVTSHSNANSVVVMSAAANGGILRSGSVSVSDVGNYLEPITRHRTRSNASRDGFSRTATQSLPSNLAFADNGQSNGAVLNGGPHYVNEDVSSLTGMDRDQASAGSSSLRSPLTPPANLPLLHEYANTAPAMDESGPCINGGSNPDAAESSGIRLTGLQEELPIRDPAEPVASVNQQKVLYSFLDLQKNLVGAMKGSNGCRQVVLRGHSLDDNTNYARLDDLLKQEHSAKHLYMNVTPNDSQKRKDNSGVVSSNNFVSSKGYNSCRDRFYANVVPGGRQNSVESPASSAAPPANCVPKEGNAHPPHLQHSQSLQQPVSHQVNYAVLDLNHRDSNSSGGSVSLGPSNGGGGCDTAPTSPTSLATPPEFLDKGALEGYSTIDFDKTAALLNSTVPCLDDDESVRKTRHNSNISDLLHSKHSSVIGE